MNSLDFTTSILSNHVILDCIFEFLPLDDVKLFRLICPKWKDISERSFKKRVRICFDFDHMNGNNNSFINIKHPAPEDLNAFFRTSQITYPFTALRFSGALSWTNSALTQFFSTEGKYITDLVLNEVKLKPLKPLKSYEEFVSELINKYTVNEDSFDEDTFNEETVNENIEIGGFHFMSIFGGIVNLEKLDIDSYSRSATTDFSLTLHDLARIQYIKLKNCFVELTDCRITPKELKFDKVTFVQCGKVVDSVLLNDFVNFTLMEKLTTFTYVQDPECETKKMKLNLFGSEKIKFMEVSHLDYNEREMSYDIVDFKNSSWEIETLHLFGIRSQQMNNMLIKNISFDHSQFSPHHFPQSLQKLRLMDEIDFPENLQWNFSLPNLKILDLTGPDTINAVFPHLRNCFPNLVELKLTLRSQFDYEETTEIDVNLIPPHVQKILFYDYVNYGVFVGDGVRAIETVVLQDTTSVFVEDVCEFFVPNNLIVFAEKEESKVDMEESLLMALSEICNQGIIFGLFDWTNTGNSNNDFVFPSADMPGEYYAYINGRGDVVKWEYGARNTNPVKFIQFQKWLNSSDK